MAWQPSQYLKFSSLRLRPALDLLAQVTLESAQSIYDLGCGTGNVTGLLAERWPAATVTGVDSSPTMLDEARVRAGNVRWLQRDLTEWRPEAPPDLIFSNSALHWLPDHAALILRLFGYLSSGGVLAVQMPANFSEPSHTLIAAAASDGRWRSRLEPLQRPNPVLPADEYHDVLAPLAGRVDVWETRYMQVLNGQDAVKEWTKGSWLKQFLDALEPFERGDFEATYAGLLRAAYPMRADGTTLFPFRRLFIVASAA
jgi:trans-aconitate 2-methyltransferase